MSQIKLSENFIKSNVKLALNEDLYPSGDITSDLIKNNKLKVCVVGLGYVGLPLAIEFRKKIETEFLGILYCVHEPNTRANNSTRCQLLRSSS